MSDVTNSSFFLVKGRVHLVLWYFNLQRPISTKLLMYRWFHENGFFSVHDWATKAVFIFIHMFTFGKTRFYATSCTMEFEKKCGQNVQSCRKCENNAKNAK